MLKVIREDGFKRPIVILHDLSFQIDFEKLKSSIDFADLIILGLPGINIENWKDYSNEIKSYFFDKKIKQCTCLTFSETTSVVINLYLEEQKLFRSIALVNPHTRPGKSFFQKLIDKFEAKLPMGLPFRFKTRAFDCKPFLQRLRCPILVVKVKSLSSFNEEETNCFLNRVPTAYKSDLNDLNSFNKLVKSLKELRSAPPKCPQKNLDKVNVAKI